MKLYILIYLTLGLTLLSCDTTKQTTETVDNTIETVKSDEARLADAGFAQMVVVDMKNEGGCSFVLKDKKTGTIYNPISWIDEDENKVNGKVVWVKYHTSKIAQTTCLSSTPIVMEELKLPN